ncbi:vp80 [Peridroma alphabaculovirus]|uniref:Vp80 n=1 Tax=Peridroma alphabaculovirus TaxID=1346829 RepID=A0A068LRK8_9ABAC|nr:vp80 [Peridroma alphabaculovirus]AIE47815.1 vp80 [Peridroma alphabaculovirus]
MDVTEKLEKNSYRIKKNYALMLIKYLRRARPQLSDLSDSMQARIEGSQNEKIGVARFVVDNVIHTITETLDYTPAVIAVPSTSGVVSEPMEQGNDDDDELKMDDLQLLLTDLLVNHSLQTLTLQSLSAFNDSIAGQAVIHEDLFRNGIDLDDIDCKMNVQLQKFIRIFERYGAVRCVVTNLEYYAERLRQKPEVLAAAPPTVRAALVTVMDLAQRRAAYTTTLVVDPAEFNTVTDDLVKTVLNKYSEHRSIEFRNGAAASTAKKTTASAATSTDEDDDAANYTQTMRRKRKTRAPTPSLAKMFKAGDTRPTPAVLPATGVSDEAFISNVKQMHAANVVVPRLLVYVINVVPADVPSSLLTCPTNGLSDAKISVNNYNSTVGLIDKMNLTVINENVYFYKLLEPLACYGASETMTTRVLWFIARAAHYFTQNARNYPYLRDKLRAHTSDPDRVALFMIRYNFLWFYRQFISELMHAPTTPYQSQKILNILHVHASVVQKEYNSLRYAFNETRVYVGPVDNVIKLMVVSLSDILA